MRTIKVLKTQPLFTTAKKEWIPVLEVVYLASDIPDAGDWITAQHEGKVPPDTYFISEEIPSQAIRKC